MAKIYGLKYTGGGFIVGIPSRDLKPEEVKKYGKDWLLASGLYSEYPSKRKAETKHEEES